MEGMRKYLTFAKAIYPSIDHGVSKSTCFAAVPSEVLGFPWPKGTSAFSSGHCDIGQKTCLRATLLHWYCNEPCLHHCLRRFRASSLISRTPQRFSSLISKLLICYPGRRLSIVPTVLLSKQNFSPGNGLPFVGMQGRLWISIGVQLY